MLDNFSLFAVQNAIILPRSPDTTSQWPTSFQRLVTSIAIHTENLILVFCNSSTQTRILDDIIVCVESLEFSLYAEIDHLLCQLYRSY